MTKISEIEGIGPAIGEKLAKAEILTVEKLLAVCAGPQGREEVAIGFLVHGSPSRHFAMRYSASVPLQQ